MCDSCGTGQAAGLERMLASNDRTARRNREDFREHDVLVVNLMGGPGAGKTMLLEATIAAIGPDARIGVLSGDLATGADADRARAAGAFAESIATGSACHLDAEMVRGALRRLPWREFDYLFIENLGNLVCPARYDLGQSVNVVALAVTDGEDKPLKYPTIFQKADLVLLTKLDLLPRLDDVHVDTIRDNLALVMPQPAMLPVSAKTGEGIDRWVRWLRAYGRPRAAACAVGAW